MIQMVVDRLYGLSAKVVCLKSSSTSVRLITLNTDSSNTKGLASVDWLILKDGLETLTVGVAEATLLQRAVAFNRVKVQKFFDEFNSIMYDTDGNQIVPPGRNSTLMSK